MHIDNFKTNIEKEFSLLKEDTRKNVENFQSSLNLQQTYSVALFSHMNNIYNKLVKIQQQLLHSTQHMNTGDVIQIEVPDFDPDIDEVLLIPTDQNTDYDETQGSFNSTQQLSEKTGMSMVSKRYAFTNNKYVEGHNSSKSSSFILYLDAKNLYGRAMQEYLPWKILNG